VLAATSAFGKWEKKQYSPSHKTTTFKKHMYKKERKHFFLSCSTFGSGQGSSNPLFYITAAENVAGPDGLALAEVFGLEDPLLVGVERLDAHAAGHVHVLRQKGRKINVE